MRVHFVTTGVALAVLCLGVRPAVAQTAADERSGLEDFIRRYEADRAGLGRFYDLPWSEARIDRLEKLYRDWQQRLADADFEQLDQGGRIDYLLLRNKLTAERDHGTRDRARLAEMDPLLSFRRPLQDLELARWRMAPLDPAAAAAQVAAVSDQVKKLRERIEKGRKPEPAKDAPAGPAAPAKPAGAGLPERAQDAEPLRVSALLARRAASAVDEIRGTLKTWFSFYDGSDPGFSWWLKKPYEDAGKALEDYAKFLREEIAGLKGKDDDPLLGEPIGAEALAKDLAGEMIAYTPEELIGIGEREFTWCEAEMKKAAREMGLGDDWKAALAKVKADYVPPGAQGDLVAQDAREAIRFVTDHDLVTVPLLCEETWRVTMLSPEAQKTLPYAAYGGQNMQVAYASEAMKYEDKLMAMRGNNRHFTRIVTAHELIPGHHLQGFVAARHHAYRSLFSTPFLVEGWALYWELRLWDLGYGKTPEDRIGMLFWRMHRCARIIVSLKFHLGQMSPAQMVDFLVERVGHERFGATSEVRRFIGDAYGPLYQCGYMIGGLQLRALRRELVESGKMTDRQFNDAVLSCNAIPVELIRAGMLNVPLSRTSQASWKFAGAAPAAK